jgi:hypothetical protein
MVILQQKDAEELVAGQEDTGASDKFLVQSVDVADDFFENVCMKQQKVLPNSSFACFEPADPLLFTT